MADIHKIALPDGSSYDLISKKTYGIFRGAVDSTSTATAFTATIDGITELYDGLTISLRNPVITSASGCTLNINNLGAKGLWASQLNAAITIGFPKNGEFLFTYDATNNRWIKQQGTQTTNYNTIGEYAGSCIAGPGGMARYSLIMKVDETHWESFVTSSSTATTKTKNAHGFLINSPILYQTGSTYTNGQVADQNGSWVSYSIDTRYSTNGGSFSAVGKPFYIVGYIQNQRFYLAQTWWADALPSLSSDNIYIYIGQMYSSSACTLVPHHPIYKYIGDEWKQVVYADLVGDAATVNGHTVNADVPENADFTNYWHYNNSNDCIELIFPN